MKNFTESELEPTAPHDRLPLMPRPTYWLTRFMILRLLGFVYAFAFFSAAWQIVPLIGSDGLLPVGPFLQAVGGGSSFDGFLQLPSVFWLDHSDITLRLVCWAGVILSLIVLAGYANAPLLLILWFLYMSIIHVGQDWYGYGWEFQLLETGFLAVFLCPLWDMRPFPRREPPIAVIWLFRWLIFRIMLGAGLIKLRGDSCWRDFTALYYHFETQPIPNPISYGFHFLPKILLRIGVGMNHLAELVAPWGVFWPGWLRTACGLIIIFFHGILILSGNLSFLNWLTIIPALACFDDAFWSRLLPRFLVQQAETARAQAVPSPAMQAASWVLVVVIVLLSFQPIANLLSPDQAMNRSYDPLHLVNTYGAFGTIGRERYTIVFEGTDDPHPGDTSVWKEYSYLAQPTDPHRMPRQIAPYQPRLDWQIWFAAMDNPNDYPWTLHLVWKLLHNDPGALSLFGPNPFPDHPPKVIRAVLYRYHFAPPGNAEGVWWQRDKLGLWLPSLSTDNKTFTSFLDRANWLDGYPAAAE